MLVLDPHDRISAGEAIKHPWFTTNYHIKSGDLTNTMEALKSLQTFSVFKENFYHLSYRLIRRCSKQY